jgi:spermidine synthase
VYVVKGIHLRSATNLIVVVVIAQIAYTPVSDAKLKDNFTIIHRESSRYAELSVLQRDDGSRLLLMDGTTQNWVAGEGFDRSLFEYSDVIASHLSQYPSSSRNALVLGLGAGVFPKNLKALGWSVDTVEINPAVPMIARDYFNFDPTLPVYIQDGRSFLEEARANNKRYGLIVLDVANGGGQPAHLFNIEAFQLMHDLLEEDGVLANNQLLTLADGMNEIALHSLATLRQLFPHVRGFDVYPEQSDEWLTNFVIFSSKQPPIDPEHRSHLQETLYERETNGYRVISDDWNPFELWAVKDNEQWHRNIIEWLGVNAVIVI